MADWHEQYGRVLRSYQRIRGTNQPKNDYEDAFWCFFMNCWHLKDWIKNDATLGSVSVAIVMDAENSKTLQACRTIADKIKHLRLDQPHSIDSRIIGDIKLGEPAARDAVSYGWHVELNATSNMPLLDFAESVVREWKEILTRHKLIT